MKKEQRLEYCKALDKSHVEGDYQDFIQLIATLEKEATESP